jgi:hypothetical protein
MFVVLALNNKETASSNKPQQKRKEASHKKDINISSVRSPYKNALFISI